MNGHVGIDTIEATEHLKNILNVGKSESESVKLKSITNGNMETSGDGNLVLSEGSYQKVDLCGSKDSSHISIYGNDVDIYSSPLECGATCSQVIVEDMVDYGWEEKYYYGKLISIHLSGLYLAYVLKPANNRPGYVRLLRMHLDLRHLIRDYKHEVKDIAFAHTTSQVLLGSVDACGELLVHKISDDGSAILCNLIVHILRPSEWTPSDYNRLIWCLYIPDDNENLEDDTTPEDVTTLLVVTHNERAEIWNIGTIEKEHGHGHLTIDEVKVGVQVISEHKKPISAATFSPDGTALAIGSLDGIVKFFQVNTLEKDISPRCLHQWTPHPEKSLSSLYFLDNHKNHRPDIQFWKFAVTGAENNTELKVWSCETWACLQTIRIHPNPEDLIMPCLKAEMDLSSKYLFLSDIKRKVLLILLIQQEPLASSAFIKSLSEFRVPLPVLSLAIGSVNSIKLHSSVGGKTSDDEGEPEQVGDSLNDGEENRNKYIIRLFWIQAKTLQSCRILYKPKVESPLHSVGSVSSLSQDSFVYKDGLSDISLDGRDTSARSGKELDISIQKGLCIVDERSTSSLTTLPSHISNFSNCTEVLLTPDDFTSPSHSNLSAQNSFSHHEEVSNSVQKSDTTTRLSDGIDSLPVEPSSLQRRKSSQHSATSSPSREVAEILAPNKGLHSDEINSESASIKMKVDDLSNSLNSFAMSGSPVSSRNQQEYHIKEWPQAPDPNKDYRITSRNESDIKGGNSCFISNNAEASPVTLDVNTSQTLLKLNQSVENLMLKMDSLSEVLSDNRSEIQAIQNEIKVIRQDQKHNQQNVNFSTKLDHVIAQHLIPDYTRLENLILKTSEEKQRRSERDLALLSDDISATFGSRLETTLKQELSSCILPQINRVLDTVAQKIQLEFSQKLSTTEATVRESFMKHVKGKAFIDCLAQTITSSLQNVVQSACKEVFQTSVVPAFEKACHHLFQQLNEIFSKGTSDYFQLIERQGQSSCSILESTATHIKAEINNLVGETQQTIRTHVSQAESRQLELMRQQETFVADLRQMVLEEIRRAFKEQTTVLNSRSATPVPHSDPLIHKQHLMQLVKQGNLNDAFQQALSAMDVQLVLFLCESVSLDQVFGPTSCPLQQHVLLSLVNQLSADLSVKTEIKVRYIEDVITCLDSNNSIIKDHIQRVLDNLQQRIASFLQRNPNHNMSRNLRRISLAIQPLIKS